MELLENIKLKINEYLDANFQFRCENQIELEFIRLNGLSNSIYLVKVFDKTSNTIVKELIFRAFGEVSDLVDRETEKEIIDHLSFHGLTPGILETDDKSYRIEEYVSNSDTLSREFLNEDFIIEKILNVLISYSLITSICNFSIISDKLSKEYKFSFDPKLHKIHKQNIFDKCLNLMFNRAKKNFEKFKHKLGKKYDHFINEEVMMKIDKIKSYMENYKNLFVKIFPKKGLISLNHNDIHSLNLLLTEDTDKIIVLDHEYACMNLIGVDIVNYLIETKFDYTLKEFPFYSCSEGNFEVDFSKFYKIFLNFINKFEKAHHLENSQQMHIVHNAKDEKYFYKIVCVINLFWFVYSVMYLDYDEMIERKKIDQISHACDRIKLYEKAYEMLKNLKLKKEVEKFDIDEFTI